MYVCVWHFYFFSLCVLVPIPVHPGTQPACYHGNLLQHLHGAGHSYLSPLHTASFHTAVWVPISAPWIQQLHGLREHQGGWWALFRISSSYVRICIHTYIRTCMHTYVRMYIRTCIYMYMYVYTYIHVQYYSTCVHVSIYVHTYVHTYVYIHTVHTCAYIHIYPKTGCASVHPAPNPSDGHVPHGARHGSPVLKTGRTGTSLLQRCPGYQRGPLCL